VNFALGHAGDAFNDQGELVNDAARRHIQAVIDQVLWAASRLQTN
jgi:chromate reductase